MSEGAIHVEMYDGQTFCGASDYRYDGVNQEDWHEHEVALNKATCTACLDKIWRLGQRAGDRSFVVEKNRKARIASFIADEVRPGEVEDREVARRERAECEAADRVTAAFRPEEG